VVARIGLAETIFFREHSHMRHISDKSVTKLRSLVLGLQQLLDSLESEGIALTAEQEQRIAEFQAARKCLYCGDPLIGETRRGCHQACYVTLMNRINRGELTLRDAVERGWITPTAAKPGRKTKRPDPLRDGRKLPSVLAAEASLDSQERKRASRDKRRDKEKPKA
jgi:hypothetical protein